MKTLMGAVAIVVLLGVGFLGVHYYSFLFSKKVSGVILNVDRVPINSMILQNGPGPLNPQVFSYAIAIKMADGEILTASSEDRQWAVVQAGQCAEAVYFPYPPWEVMKAGTYFGARLDRLYECPK